MKYLLTSIDVYVIGMSILLILSITSSSHSQSVKLFDNETLDGWTIKGDVKASFNDDVVSLESGEDHGILWSDAIYDHFVLRGECFLEPGLAGALLFRQPGKHDLAQGYALSLTHQPDQQNPTGSIINVARGTWLPRFDTAGWFSFVLKAHGDYLVVKIDDQIVAQTRDHRSRDGHLGFKITNGSMLKFRELTLTDLADPGHTPDIRDHFNAAFNIPFTEIFDGKSLDGWSNHGGSTWDVENGILHGYSGDAGGFLISDGSYKNFHLILDFKIIKEDNSGIFIRRPAEAAEVTIQNSIECNIYDHNGFEHAYSTGSLATHARAWSNLINYEGWNTAEILAHEDQVAMYINGVKASQADLPQFNQAGNICLQAGIKVFHPTQGPSDIYFRNIRVKSLD